MDSKITIHLIEIDEKPTDGQSVNTGCGTKMIFKHPIHINYEEDGRLCDECYKNHRNCDYKRFTFAHM